MGRKSNFWTYLFLLAAGIALICMHTKVELLSWVIMFIGAMFAIPGLIGVISGIIKSSRSERVDGMSVTSSLGSLIIGVILIVWPTPFVGVFVYILAAILIIGGLCQVWALATGYRPYKMPFGLYILPVLIIITGVVIICSSLKEIQEVFTLMAGIAMVATAANGLFIYLTAYNAVKRSNNRGDITDHSL